MGSSRAVEIAAALREHPQRAALSGAVKEIALAGARDRSVDVLSTARDATLDLTGDQADTPFGNVAEIVKAGARDDAARALVAALLALAFTDAPDAAEEAAADLVWLAAHTPFDAFPVLEHALGAGMDRVARRLAELVDAPETGGAGFGLDEAVMAAAILRSGTSEAARAELTRLAQTAKHKALRVLLQPVPHDTGISRLDGELSPTPKNPWLTTVMALTLVLFVVQAARTVARFVLSYRRPAQLTLTPRGLEITQRTELMGRVLRDRSIVVPLSQLVRVTREVRFGRAGLYAGLVALVLGSYLGMGLFVDALRVPGASFSLLSMAVAMVVAGLGLDYGLTSLSDGVRGKCRVIVVPAKGKPVCLGALDAARTDAILANIAEATRS